MVEINSIFSRPLRVWNTEPDISEPPSAPPFCAPVCCKSTTIIRRTEMVIWMYGSMLEIMLMVHNITIDNGSVQIHIGSCFMLQFRT